VAPEQVAKAGATEGRAAVMRARVRLARDTELATATKQRRAATKSPRRSACNGARPGALRSAVARLLVGRSWHGPIERATSCSPRRATAMDSARAALAAHPSASSVPLSAKRHFTASLFGSPYPANFLY